MALLPLYSSLLFLSASTRSFLPTKNPNPNTFELKGERFGSSYQRWKRDLCSSRAQREAAVSAAELAVSSGSLEAAPCL